MVGGSDCGAKGAVASKPVIVGGGLVGDLVGGSDCGAKGAVAPKTFTIEAQSVILMVIACLQVPDTLD